MKKCLALLLTLTLLFTFASCGMNSASSGDDAQNGDSQTDNSNPSSSFGGWKLPAGLTTDEDPIVIDFVWTDTTCSFVAEGTTFLFTYDPAAKTLDFSIKGNGETQTYDDICTFDDEGHLKAINLKGQTVLELAYGDSLTVTDWGEEEETDPVNLAVDWEAHTMPMPPFDSKDILTFTDHGDILGGEDTTVCAYEYDEAGNILTLSSPDLGNYAMHITYSDTPVTHLWQKVPMKLIPVWVLGRPFAVFAMDMLCLAAYDRKTT